MVEYNMTETMAKEILKTRQGEEKKMQPQAFLAKYVQEQFGVKGICVKVSNTL